MSDRVGSVIGVLVAGAVAALTAVLLLAANGRDPDVDLAVTGVDVVPMTGDTVLYDQTLLVAEGRILRVGPSRDVRVPDGARLIDGTGAYVMPGLRDMHVHLPTRAILEGLGLPEPEGGIRYESSLVPYLANGITTIRVMSGADDLLHLRDSVARGEVLGPRMIVGSPMIDGNPPILPEPITRIVDSEEEAARAVREIADARYDFVKIRSGVSRIVFDALRGTAAEVEIPIVGHVPEGDSLGLDYVLRSGPFGVAHLEEFPSGGRGQREEDLESYVKLALETGASVTTTLTVYADLLDQLEDPTSTLTDTGSRNVPTYLRRSFWRGSVSGQDTSARRADALRRQLRFLRRLAGRLHEAGVPTMVGTDALVPTVAPGASIHRELALLAESGLSEYDVLRMATVVPAREISGTAAAGTVTEGAPADLLLLEGDPLESLDALRQVAGLIVQGRYLSAGELARRLEAVQDAYGAPDS